MADNQYPSWVGLIFVFNLIVGTGALTIPAVFAAAGWLFSSIMLITLALVSFITVTFVLESIACANAFLHLQRVRTHKIDESEAVADSSSELSANEETAMTQNRSWERYYTLNSKVEMGEMAKLFFNKVGRIMFFVSLCLYLYGDLAIYATAISMTVVDLSCSSNSNVSESDYSVKCWESSNILKIQMYRIVVVLFALCVCPFAYFSVQKTKYLQILTTIFRWSAFLIMIGLATARLARHGQVGHPPVVNLYRLPGLLGSSVYSFMCHHSVPGLISPFANKQNIIKQMGLDYVLICGFYLLLALTGSFAFETLEDLYTLNFLPKSTENSSVFSQIVMYFLGAFPVFTLSTSFPIIAITLQNNLKSLFLDDNVQYRFLLRRLAFPTLAVVPPIIVSISTHNLHTLVAITGSYAGAIIQYIIPAFLVFYARKHCKREIGNCVNRYASPFKHVFWFWFVIIWAIVCVIFVTVNFIIR